VDSPVQFLDYWYFSVPNYVLAALMYSLLARFVLSLFISPDSPNYIFRFFVRITDPLVRLFGFVTPRVAPPLLVVLFSAVWLLMIRFALFVGMAQAGLAPTVSG
jgi:YggT family protein